MANVVFFPGSTSKLLWCGGTSQKLRTTCCCKCTVTFSKYPSGYGSISSTGGSNSCSYSSTATPNSGVIFDAWYDDSGSRKTVSRDINVTCKNGERHGYTALFVKNGECSYTTKVECTDCPSGISGGTVTPASATGTWGNSVHFTFTAATVSKAQILFDGWYSRKYGSDRYLSGSPSENFTCPYGNTDVLIAKCHYEGCDEAVSVTVNSACSSNGVSCDQGCGNCRASGTTANCDSSKFKKGTTVFLSCSVMANQCDFDHWNDHSTENVRQIVADSNKSFTGYIYCPDCSGNHPGGCIPCGTGRKWYHVWCTGTGCSFSYTARVCRNSCKKTERFDCDTGSCAIFCYGGPSGAPHSCEAYDSDHFSCKN